MPDDGFDPETVALLDTALGAACQRAAPLVAVREETRTILAAAVLEGARRGIRDKCELTKFALRAIPAYRTPGA